MRLVRVGICALVAFGVLAHGGVEDWARAIFEIGAAALFVAWTVHFFRSETQEIYISPLLPPLGALLVVVLFQLAAHTTASMFHTHEEFSLLLADVILLFLATQAFRTLEDWRGFVWFAMIFGFLVTIFAILQHLTFNGKLYWVRELHFGGMPFGPYVNRNHFAGFAELFIPMSLVPLMLGKVRRERLVIVGLFAAVSIGGLLLSASRGGVVSFVAEVVVIAIWMTVKRTGSRQVLAGAVVLAAALLLVSWLGVKQITQRFASMKSMEVATGKRASMRRDTWRIFMDHTAIGTGLGTLQLVYPPYESLYDGKVVNHSHNDYLEALAETGIAGGLCCALFLGMLGFHSLRNMGEPSSKFAAVLNLSGFTACCGFLTHSIVDFNLHLPANALLFFLMAALATSRILPAPAVTNRRHEGQYHNRKH